MIPEGDDWVVRLDHVSKEYRLHQERSNIRSLVPGRVGEVHGTRTFSALDDVSLTVRAGEAVGVVGANGAGKSTVLKLLAGILQPSAGTVRTRGRIASVIELGVGFDPDLTGRENISFAGDMMGLGRREIRQKTDWIIDFSGIEEFLEMPVKRYSTGMAARLGFAVATAVRPDLLVVDEVLSVGDHKFQRKSLDRIRHLHSAGTSLVLVSHNLWMLDSLCQRLVHLDRGRVVAEGDPSEVLARYLQPDVSEMNAESADPEAEPVEPEVELDDHSDEQIALRNLEHRVPSSLKGAVTIDAMEVRPSVIRSNQPITISAIVTVHTPIKALLAMTLFTSHRAVIAERELGPSDFLDVPGTWRIEASLDKVPLSAGRYQWRILVLPEDDRSHDQMFPAAVALATAELVIEGDLTMRPGLKVDAAWTTERISGRFEEYSISGDARLVQAPREGHPD